MLSRFSPRGVRSDEGFEVEFTGTFSVAYREAGRVMTLAIERGGCSGPCLVLMDDDPFDHWDGCDLSIAPEDRARIQQNFLSALKVLGFGGPGQAGPEAGC